MAYTPFTAALLARIRASQGRELHQARPLWLVPRHADESVVEAFSDRPERARS